MLLPSTFFPAFRMFLPSRLTRGPFLLPTCNCQTMIFFYRRELIVHDWRCVLLMDWPNHCFMLQWYQNVCKGRHTRGTSEKCNLTLTASTNLNAYVRPHAMGTVRYSLLHQYHRSLVEYLTVVPSYVAMCTHTS